MWELWQIEKNLTVISIRAVMIGIGAMICHCISALPDEFAQMFGLRGIFLYLAVRFVTLTITIDNSEPDTSILLNRRQDIELISSPNFYQMQWKYTPNQNYHKPSCSPPGLQRLMHTPWLIVACIFVIHAVI